MVKKLIHILSINFALILLSLISIEFFTRLVYSSKNCLIDNDCSKFNLLKKFEVNNLDYKTYLGLSKYDEQLGYVPSAGFNKIINQNGWNSKKVTIDNNGFRLNGDINIYKEAEKYSIKIIDTFDLLKDYDPKIIWFGHHTPLGNKIICDLIKANIKLKTL